MTAPLFPRTAPLLAALVQATTIDLSTATAQGTASFGSSSAAACGA